MPSGFRPVVPASLKRLVRFRVRTMLIAIALFSAVLPLFLRERTMRRTIAVKEKFHATMRGEQVLPPSYMTYIPGPIRYIFWHNYGETHCFDIEYNAGQKITDQDLADLPLLKRLEKLSISGNPITDVGVEHLARLQDLKEVDLSGSVITDRSLVILGGLRELETIAVSYSHISDSGIRHIASLPKLQVLYLVGTPITDSCAGYISEMKNLKELYVDYTKFTLIGAAEVWKHSPYVSIEPLNNERSPQSYPPRRRTR